MSETSRHDIRKLLKSFGVQADEALIAHIARNPGNIPLRIRIIMEDVTDYGQSPPDQPLRLEIEGEIQRDNML